MVEAAYSCASAFLHVIDESIVLAKRRDKSEEVASEFLYCFLHMLDRTLCAERGPAFRDQLVDKIADQAVRAKARREFTDLGADAFETAVTLIGLEANDAQAAYADCTAIVDSAKPFTAGLN
jgi:hypothetical protein